MTFEPLNDRLNDLPIPTSASPGAPAQPGSSPASSPAGLFLSDVTSKPLTWLWPGRIPLGHLTLLDAAPDCGLSLFALTLAACVSSGSPFPDGTPTQQGNVIRRTEELREEGDLNSYHTKPMRAILILELASASSDH